MTKIGNLTRNDTKSLFETCYKVGCFLFRKESCNFQDLALSYF